MYICVTSIQTGVTCQASWSHTAWLHEAAQSSGAASWSIACYPRLYCLYVIREYTKNTLRGVCAFARHSAAHPPPNFFGHLSPLPIFSVFHLCPHKVFFFKIWPPTYIFKKIWPPHLKNKVLTPPTKKWIKINKSA